MVNRSVAPKSGDISNVALSLPEEVELDNGMKLFYLNQDNSEVIRLEILIPAGQKYAATNLVAKATSDLLLSGTTEMNSAKIAERIDFYGAFVETGISSEFVSIHIYSLIKHLKNVLEILEEVFSDIIFPEKEVLTYSQNKKQGLLVNEEKVSFQSRRRFKELLYGKNHLYGRHTELKDFDLLNRSQLSDFYNRHYDFSSAVVFAAGKIDDGTINSISTSLSKLPKRTSDAVVNFEKPMVIKDNFHHVHKDDAVQSAIRMGKILFQKSHPDYMDFSVLNVLLGGYFGSRLMTNIREDKGYTYGIGSGVISMRDSGYFTISAEVGAEVTNAAIDEIYIELDKLREIPVSKEELNLVKNYMLGSFMRAVDGPFAQIDWYSGIYQHGLDFTFYEDYIRAISNIKAERIQDLAQKYLQEESLILVTSGAVPYKPASIRHL